MITIDSRAAGTGKTTQGIYPRLQTLCNLELQFIVVAPSIHLQQQYVRDNPNIQWRVFNSQQRDANSVVQQILAAINANEPYLLITTEAFKLLNLRDDQKGNYHLIIDEAFDPYDSIEIYQDPRINRIKQTFKLVDTDHDDWNRIYHIPPEHEDKFYNTSPFWRKLTYPNNRVWITGDDWKRIQNNDFEKIFIALELDVKILQGYSSCHIAAAAFEYTYMALWLQSNNIAVKYFNKFFKEHDVCPQFHVPEDLSYTKYFRTNNTQVLDQFHQYVLKHVAGRPLLAVKNNDETRSITGETHISHNAHGINQYQHYRDIYLVSSLNLCPQMTSFLKFMNRLINDNNEFNKWLYIMGPGYTYYQLIMRTALRDRNNTLPVNVYMLDTKIFVALLNFFDVYHLNTPIMIDVEIKPQALSSTERSRKHRERKKLNNT